MPAAAHRPHDRRRTRARERARRPRDHLPVRDRRSTARRAPAGSIEAIAQGTQRRAPSCAVAMSRREARDVVRRSSVTLPTQAARLTPRARGWDGSSPGEGRASLRPDAAAASWARLTEAAKDHRPRCAADRPGAGRARSVTCSAMAICPPKGGSAGRFPMLPPVVPWPANASVCAVSAIPWKVRMRARETIVTSSTRAHTRIYHRRALPRGRRRDRRRPGDPRRARPRRPRFRDVADRRRAGTGAAAAAAPRGRKGRGPGSRQAAAELNGRAHLRRPCVLEPVPRERRRGGGVRSRPATTRAAPGELQAMFDGPAPTWSRTGRSSRPSASSPWRRGRHRVHAAGGEGLLASPSTRGRAAPRRSTSASPPLVEREFGRQLATRPRDRDWRLTEASTRRGSSTADRTRATRSSCGSSTAAASEEGLLDGYRLIPRRSFRPLPSTWSEWSSTARRTPRSPRTCDARRAPRAHPRRGLRRRDPQPRQHAAGRALDRRSGAGRRLRGRPEPRSATSSPGCAPRPAATSPGG